MKQLVGDTPMEQGQRVEIIFSNGDREKGTYQYSFGYNHSFDLDKGSTVVLSNHFMRLKGIRVKIID